MIMQRAGACVVLLCLLTGLTGCGVARETLPERSAMEQLLISTAADRAVDALPVEGLAGKKVFIDDSRLECLDKGYVVQRIRQAVVENGAYPAAEREGSDVTLEVASGALSVDKRNYLLGIPEVAVPMPFAGGNLGLPEISILKIVSYTGEAKLVFTAAETATNGLLYEVPVCRGDVLTAYWSVLQFFGPYEWSNMPEEE